MKASLFRVVTLLTVMIILVSIPGGVFVKAQGPTGTGGVGADGPVPQVNGPRGGGPVPGGPGYVIVNAFEFIPYSQSAGYLYSGTLLKNPGSSGADYEAAVHLPQGATINQVVAYYLDNDSGVGKDIEVDLFLCNDFSTSCGIMMASVVSSGALPGVTYGVTTTIANPVVDNASYSYIVQVVLPNSATNGLNAVRIDYGYPTFLPSVEK